MTTDSGCISGRVGNESARALRVCSSVAFYAGKPLDGRTRIRDMRITGSAALTSTITNARLMQVGYPSILRLYDKLHRS